MVSESVILTEELALTSSSAEPIVQDPVLESSLKYFQTISPTFSTWTNSAQVFKKVLGILQEFYNILSTIPDVLEADKTSSVRSSITLVLANNTMDALIARDSLTGPFELNTHKKFRWGEHAQGIAGVCATRKEPVLVSDIDDPQNPDRKFLITSSTLPEGGILSLPILLNPDASPFERRECIAVFTVTTSKRKFLKEKHVRTLAPIIENIRSIFINNTLPLTSDSQVSRRLDMLVLESYATSNMERNGRGNQAQANETVKNEVQDLISELRNEIRAGKKPEKALELLEVINSTDGMGISMENLLAFFDGTKDPSRKAAAFIGLLNKRYLIEKKLKIVGTLVYKIIPTP